MNDKLEIVLNGKPFFLDKAASLIQLAETLALNGTRYAIEVNQEIVPRSQHESFKLSDADVVEVVQAIGGG